MGVVAWAGTGGLEGGVVAVQSTVLAGNQVTAALFGHGRWAHGSVGFVP